MVLRENGIVGKEGDSRRKRGKQISKFKVISRLKGIDPEKLC